MDPITLIFLGGLLLGIALIVIGLITAKWLKKKLSEFFAKKNVNQSVVIERSAFESMLVEAAKNSPKMELSDMTRTLKNLGDADLIMASITTEGEIEDVAKVKGQKGIDEPLNVYLNDNNGMLIFD